MPKAKGGGTTPSPNRQAHRDQVHADAAALAADTGCPLVLVLDARPAVRKALAAQVALLLPGARAHAGYPDGAPDALAMLVPSGRLVVRFAGADTAVLPGWEDAPVAEVRPRAVDGEYVPATAPHRNAATSVSAAASGHADLADLANLADLADVALALARCGQLRRVAEPGVPSGQRLSGTALVSAMPEVLHPLLPGVWRTAETLIGQAGDALHAEDMALLARVAHTVRGMAANYAMPEWAACAAALECSARSADVAAASDALAWLRAALSALSGLSGESDSDTGA